MITFPYIKSDGSCTIDEDKLISCIESSYRNMLEQSDVSPDHSGYAGRALLGDIEATIVIDRKNVVWFDVYHHPDRFLSCHFLTVTYSLAAEYLLKGIGVEYMKKYIEYLTLEYQLRT